MTLNGLERIPWSHTPICDQSDLAGFGRGHYTPGLFSWVFSGLSAVMHCRFSSSTFAGHPSLPWMLTILGGCLCLVGCVQRRMTIRSNPPGALAYVDDYEIGTTPISTNFTYYGTRKVRLVKDGYETLTTMERMYPPWYQIPPLDFVTENLVPGEIRDRRTLCYQLRPQMIAPPDQLLGRAEQLRGRVRATGVTEPPPAALETIPTPLPMPSSPGQPLPQGTGGLPLHPITPGGTPY